MAGRPDTDRPRDTADPVLAWCPVRTSTAPAAPHALGLNDLVMRAGAYENHLFVVVAKAGVEDGLELIGGSCVISPLGEILAKAATTGDERLATPSG